MTHFVPFVSITFCTPSHPPPCLTQPPSSIQPHPPTLNTHNLHHLIHLPVHLYYATNEDADIAEKDGQDAKALANIKELAENSNISNPELDTKGQDYSLGKKEMECAYRLSQQ